ncbi:halocyanin domain-containing protein [Halobaculum sp. MBLA0147]|uniref:halocyanin domain-containing protein n=1 Tax=Halobaculum sp. MBLA0147 TaxID=3079934 RepID=UPI003524D800
MPRTDRTPTRRQVLRGGAVAAGAALLGSAVPAASAQSGTDFGGWFDGVSNFDGVVDRTGQSEVTVEVGVQNGDGAYGFGPAAVRVSPGTTVVWEWTGKGGSHNVVADGGGFESELVGEEGHTFSQTFESAGTYKYYCTPHQALGMKGAVVVGGSGGGSGADAAVSEPNYEGWFDGVSNFDGTVDRRGQESVSLEVGVQNGDGAYGFGPAAVRVSPGTTVTWTWTGKGGSHNVVSSDGLFESELVGDEGHTFERTFESPGVYTYYCTPHEALGMKGAVVVGNVGGGGDSGGGEDGEAAAESGGSLLPVPNDFAGWLALFTGGTVALAATAILGGEAYSGYREIAAEKAAAAGGTATEAPADDTVREIDDGYDPVGTAALVAGYFVLIGLLWAFMYFVEFLAGPSIAG